ncbi:Hsp70 family protein, partial [Streptomyces sp. NPDC032161]|uniref:Hsp70 family protein n=1 Tax=unclassified Streptomyces TaxID=2593676 RepID=UPI0033C74AC8
TGLPPAPRGVPQIEVSFDIDANGIMHVTAKDLGTGKEQKMTVTGGSSLPKDDIDRMVREAEQHAEEDRQRKETAETRNRAESLLYQTEKLMKDNADKIPDDVRTETEEALTEVREKLKGDDTAGLRTATERASTAAQRIGSALYAQARGGADGTSPDGSGPGAGAGTSGGGEDEVVDAEIVDDERKEDGG